MRLKDATKVLPTSTVLVESGAPKTKALQEPSTAPQGTAWHVLKSTPPPAGSSNVIGLMAANNVQAVSLEPVDGVAYVNATLDEMRRLKRDEPNTRCVVVFDLDNTIFETRARTLEAMKAFDSAHGTSHFAGLALEDMGKNGKHTAELQGLDPATAQKVHDFWTEWFWKGPNFLCDHLMTKMAQLAHDAHEAGAEVVYLTGRVDHASTLAQLKAAKLPDADGEHLVTKPAVGANTGKFKGVWLANLLDSKDTFLGWFLTEGRRDIATVQEHDPRIPCVRLGYVHEREGKENLPHTPVLPESWSEERRPIV